MYVCVCICVYPCICISVYVCVSLCVKCEVALRVCTFVCLCVCVRAPPSTISTQTLVFAGSFSLGKPYKILAMTRR